MQRKVNVLLISLLLVSVFVVACVPPTKPDSDQGTTRSHLKKPLKLKIQNNVLEVDELPNEACPNASHKKGCFVVGVGDTLEVDFRLHTPHWKLTTLWICSGIDKPKDLAIDCTLRQDQIAEFVATNGVNIVWADQKGVMDLTKISSHLTAFQLRDFNWEAGDYFYAIQACPTDSTDPSDCRRVDPPIRNNGK